MHCDSQALLLRHAMESDGDGGAASSGCHGHVVMPFIAGSGSGSLFSTACRLQRTSALHYDYDL